MPRRHHRTRHQQVRRPVVESLGLPMRYALGPCADGWQDYESALMAAIADFTPPEITGDHLSFLPYTSGSTGKPKGVALTHEGQLWWVRTVQRYWPSTPETRVLAAMPLYPQERHGGRHQADAPCRRFGGAVARLRAGTFRSNLV